MLGKDIQFTFRSLARSPVFTAVVVISLALGIGANTAIFTLMDQVLLRLLPVQEPERLVMIYTEGGHMGNNRGSRAVSYPMFRDYREQNSVFSGIFCRFGTVVNLSFGDRVERAEAEVVSGDYFQVLGVQPARGRVFAPSDETRPNADPVVVLSHDFWLTRFNADPDIAGKTIRVNNHPLTIVGVAAPGFQGVSLGYRPSLYVPVTMKQAVTPSWNDLENRRSRWLNVFARLKPGVSREQAEAGIRTIHKQIIQEEVKDAAFRNVSSYNRDRFLRSYAVVEPAGQGFSNLRRTLTTPLAVLFGLVLLVLLITCANVSNLMVARGASRQKEISIRLALGAARGRVIRQLLVESLLLAGIGGLLSLGVAWFTSQWLVTHAPSEQARLAISPQLDLRMLLFTFAAAFAAALLFGLLPAWQAARTSISHTLKEGSGTVAGSASARLRKGLVMAQVALCFLLLIGSGLFLRSLENLTGVQPGFEASNLIRFKVDPTLSGYDNSRTNRFFWELQQRLERVPGVTGVGFAVVAILEGNQWDSTIHVEGYQSQDGENMNPHFNAVSPGYFTTMGIPVTAGRDFREQDFQSPVKVAAVNETFAQRYFPGRNPLGHRFGFGSPVNPPDHEIIAVVADAKYENLRDEAPRQVFVLKQQATFASEMTGYVRTALESASVIAAIRREVRELDPTMPIFDLSTMEDQLDRSLAVERLVGFLSTAFGVLATALCVVGLYGVMAFTVSRRLREFGVRIALGAHGTSVLGMVLREAGVLALAGIAAGLPLVWWLSIYVESQLFGVEARDPLIYGAVGLLLLLVAGGAAALPAWRASRVSPARVLRYE